MCACNRRCQAFSIELFPISIFQCLQPLPASSDRVSRDERGADRRRDERMAISTHHFSDAAQPRNEIDNPIAQQPRTLRSINARREKEWKSTPATHSVSSIPATTESSHTETAPAHAAHQSGTRCGKTCTACGDASDAAHDRVAGVGRQGFLVLCRPPACSPRSSPGRQGARVGFDSNSQASRRQGASGGVDFPSRSPRADPYPCPFNPPPGGGGNQRSAWKSPFLLIIRPHYFS